MKLGTQDYLVYIIVLKWLEQKNRHMLEIMYQVAFLMFLKIFDTYSVKIVQTLFVWHETWHTTLISIYYCFEMVRIENNCHIFEITC